MKIVMMYESLVTSCRNKKGHFLTGFLRELNERGHHVSVFETACDTAGASADIHSFYSSFNILPYVGNRVELENADLIIVDSRIEGSIIENIGKINSCIKLLHDVNFFLNTYSEAMLSGFHGVLADNASIKSAYKKTGFKKKVWLFEEAIDSRVFYPGKPVSANEKRDILLIANEDNKRQVFQETMELLVEKGLTVTVVGDGYDLSKLKEQIDFKGWVPFYQLPQIISAHRFSLHLPSTVGDAIQLRFLEAFAGGIPLISIGDDPKNYFNTNLEFVHLDTFTSLPETIRIMNQFPVQSQHIITNGLRAVNRYHTCFHRVNLLEEILISLGVEKANIVSGKKWEWRNPDTENDGFSYKLGS